MREVRFDLEVALVGGEQKNRGGQKISELRSKGRRREGKGSVENIGTYSSEEPEELSFVGEDDFSIEKARGEREELV